MNSFGLPEISDGGFGTGFILYGVIVFVVRLIMALAVNGDAKRQISGRGGLFLFGPFLWGWIVMIFGLAGIALYWVIHHSSLRATTPPNAR